MTPHELRQRTLRFAIDVVRFTKQLPATDAARAMGNQLLRAGTAVGANYRAACRSRSLADFIAKLGLVIEECDETGYWMELLVETRTVRTDDVARLLDEADQLTRIFVRSRETARKRAGNR